MENLFSESNRIELLRSYFKTNSLAKHQIDTFNQFISSDISRILDNEANCIFEGKSSNGEHGTIFIHIENPIIASPQILDYDSETKTYINRRLFPQEARTKMLTYDSVLYCDIVEYMINIKIDKIDSLKGPIDQYLNYVTTYHRISIARIPIMLRSFKCNLNSLSISQYVHYKESSNDPGGYFIINGNERILIGQIRNAYNKSICLKKQSPTGTEIISCEMRSMSEETGHSALVQLKSNIEYNAKIYICILKVWIDVDPVINFLTCQSNGSMDSSEQQSSETSLTQEHQTFITNDLFPHLGMGATKQEKLICISSMIKKINLVKQNVLVTDEKDSYANKRVEMAGLLCYELFRMLYKKFIKSVTNSLEKKKRMDIDLFSKNALITNGLHFSFATGNWGVQKNNYIRTGVSQIIQNKVSHIGLLSHLRKMVIPLGKEGKNTQIRQLHPSSAFFACPSETPEGQFVGLTLSMSMLCNISCHTSPFIIKHYILKYLLPLDCNDSVAAQRPEKFIVFLNGFPCGTIHESAEIVKKINFLKQNSYISHDIGVTICNHLKEIHIISDAGRFTRPLINIKNIIKDYDKVEWNNIKKCIAMNYITYYDATTIEQMEIAIDAYDAKHLEKYDWMEIHPSCMLGLMAAQIPYPEHTQSPRICYQSSMAKQAIGYIPGYTTRSNTSTKTMNIVERPLITTHIAEMTGSNEYPNGVNVIVAELIYTGFNQEDSIILKKEALERGLFNALSIKTITCEEKIGNAEKICIPPGPLRRSYANYDTLEKDPNAYLYGIVKCRTFVKKNDILVGKLSKITESKGETTEIDKSILVTSGDEGFIHEIIKTTKRNITLVKIIIVQSKFPEIGDKFCSAMAQKGTCGMIMSEVDMPFCNDGTVPDILINPHCIPSRMTINQLMASIHGLLCCEKGLLSGDASPFQENFYNNPIVSQKTTDSFEKDSKLSILRNELLKCGLSSDGTKQMYNGMTGEKLVANIFIGPVYYHRLTHIVSDKIFARPNTNQKRNAVTRQPLNGRANDGGLRIGEMEKDDLVAHGCSTFLQEKMFDQSDKFFVHLCKECLHYTTIEKYTNGKNSYMVCYKCDSANVKKIILPFATKLVLQELNAICIKTQIDI